MNNSRGKQPIIFSVGGGKGGVGKSMVSTNLAIQYAQAGMKVILIDLDIGAANVHTLFGIRQPPQGLGDYFTTQRSQLQDYLVETNIKNLYLVPGSGFVPELMSLKHFQKVKLINHIRKLDADLIILDLGAGSSHHVVDFFSMTNAGIVVTAPEPTATVNAYEFLKNVVYRILFRLFKKNPETLQLIKRSSIPGNPYNISTIKDLIEKLKTTDEWAAKNIEEICHDLNFYLVFNQAKKVSDTKLGIKLCKLCKRYLNLDLQFVGQIFYNEEVSSSVLKMSPFSIAYPESITSKIIKRIAISIFKQVSNQITSGTKSLDTEKQLHSVITHAQHDFEENLLTQKRIQREISRV